jgi:hypothetical protein
MKALMRNYDGIADRLKNGPYAEPALVPESQWLGRQRPARPNAAARLNGGDLVVEMNLPNGELPWQWLVRAKRGDRWQTSILPGSGNQSAVSLEMADEITALTVAAVTRLGRLGPATRVAIEGRE